MSALGPPILLVVEILILRLATPRVNAWVGQRRRDLAVLMPTSFLISWALVLWVGASMEETSMFDLVITPVIAGLGAACMLLLMIYGHLWLLDHKFLGYYRFVNDLFLERFQKLRGPLASMFEPYDESQVNDA
jgi:hypothetical protein